MEKFDIVAVGESLIDFVSTPGADAGKLYLEGNAGGAPANVLAMVAKLGGKSAFISKVGQDAFGDYLCQNIQKAGVNIRGVMRGAQPTTLAMVSLDATGNRSFAFYRNQTADVMLRQEELDATLLENAGVFHFGSVSMTAQPASGATLAAAEMAAAAGARISFDPNYRPLLWEKLEDAVTAMKQGLALAHYVKVSDEEATLLTGEADPEKAAVILSRQYGFAFIAVTLGPKGCIGITPAAQVRLPTYDVPTVDTTGAGDAFWGAVLYRLLLLEAGAAIDEALLSDILGFGNAAGSLVTTRHGAIAPQPTEEQIYHCMKNTKLLQ